jgi:hypothetical protein
MDLRPRNRGDALEHVIRELFSGEVAILEECARFNFDVTDWAEFLDKGTKRMERADRLPTKVVSSILASGRAGTYMTFDTRNKELVSVGFGVLNKVGRCLFSRDGNKRNTLVGRLEPNNLGSFNGSTARLLSAITFPFTPFSFLLLLGSGRGGAKQAQGTGKELTRHTFNNGHYVSRKLRLDFVSDPREIVSNVYPTLDGNTYSSSSKSISP